MKNVVQTFVFCALTMSPLHCTTGQVSCVVCADIDGARVDATAQALVKHLFLNDGVTRKKHQTLPIILNGIAQALVGVSQVLGAQSPEAKQQGIANVLGTVINVTAQLSAKTNHNQQQQSNATVADMHNQTQTKLAELTEVILDQLDQEEIRGVTPLPQYLAMVKQLPKSERQSWIKVLLASPHSKQFLKELFTAVFGCIEHNVPVAIGLLKDRIKQYVARIDQQTSGQTKTSNWLDDRALDLVAIRTVMYACTHVRSLVLQDVDAATRTFLMRHLPQYNQGIQGTSGAVLEHVVRQENQWFSLYLYRQACRTVAVIE